MKYQATVSSALALSRIQYTLGQSSAPEVEKDVLSDYGTYGKQPGQIGDALLVLIECMPRIRISTVSPPLPLSRKCSIRWPILKSGITVRRYARDLCYTMVKI